MCYRLLSNILNFGKVSDLGSELFYSWASTPVKTCPAVLGEGLFFLLANKDSGIKVFNCRNYISKSEELRGECVREELIRCV